MCYMWSASGSWLAIRCGVYLAGLCGSIRLAGRQADRQTAKDPGELWAGGRVYYIMPKDCPGCVS